MGYLLPGWKKTFSNKFKKMEKQKIMKNVYSDKQIESITRLNLLALLV